MKQSVLAMLLIAALLFTLGTNAYGFNSNLTSGNEQEGDSETNNEEQKTWITLSAVEQSEDDEDTQLPLEDDVRKADGPATETVEFKIKTWAEIEERFWELLEKKHLHLNIEETDEATQEADTATNETQDETSVEKSGEADLADKPITGEQDGVSEERDSTETKTPEPIESEPYDGSVKENQPEAGQAEEGLTKENSIVERTEEAYEEKASFSAGICIVGVGIVLVSAIVVALIFERKKEKKDDIQHTFQPSIPIDSETMTVTYLSGERKGHVDVAPMKELFLIGAAEECDLQIKGYGFEEKHAKIYVKNARLFIEDLDTNDGTYLNGMRLYSANCLRSNDLVTIGTVSFRVTF